MEKAKKLQQLIEDSGYSVNKVAKLAGIPQSTLATMLKNGVGKAGIDGVASVCAVLGITLDDLIKSCSLNEALEHWKPTQQEQILVKKYRQLPETGKQAVENMMDTMLAAQPKQSDESDKITSMSEKQERMVPVTVAAFGDDGSKPRVRMVPESDIYLAEAEMQRIEARREAAEREREEDNARIRAYYEQKNAEKNKKKRRK